MRGDQLSRQWQILRQIEVSKNGLTASEIAELCGVSLRTAYRDLDDLQFAGFPLYTEKGEKVNRWKFVDSYMLKVPQPFSFTELISLHLSRDLFKVFKGTAFFESLQSLFDKILAALPPQMSVYLDQIETTFHAGITPYKDYERFGKIIDQVNIASIQRRSVEMMYKPLRSKKETLRKIDPYNIRLFEGTIYIIGFCHLRNDIRTFVLDRIKLLRLTDEKFEIRSDFNLDEYIKYSFKVMQDELFTVRIRITPAWARYMGEKIWHESQQTKKLSDESLEMTFQVAGLDEIKQWIMSLGPAAYVVEPEKLKNMIKSDLKKAMAQYEGTVHAYLKPQAKKSQSNYFS